MPFIVRSFAFHAAGPETFPGASNRLHAANRDMLVPRRGHTLRIVFLKCVCVCVFEYVFDGSSFGPGASPETFVWPLSLALSIGSHYLSVFAAVITLIHFLLLARLLHS